MIYSTDYKELYRRVQNEEDVLCLVHEGIYSRPAIAKMLYGKTHVLSPGVQWFTDVETESEFVELCNKYNLQFVPDNEGLVKAAQRVIDNGNVFAINDLQTILKQYE